MSLTATGTFKVTITPQSAADVHDGVGLGRLSIDKRFEGDLVGVGKGEMLTAMTAVKDSAGYVAIERVQGHLGGRRGSFVFQHSGTMQRGAQRLSITVVPDSGSGELSGLSGTLTLNIENGTHYYEFTYSLPA